MVEYIDTEGGSWKLLKDLECSFQHKLDSGEGDYIPEMNLPEGDYIPRAMMIMARSSNSMALRRIKVTGALEGRSGQGSRARMRIGQGSRARMMVDVVGHNKRFEYTGFLLVQQDPEIMSTIGCHPLSVPHEINHRTRTRVPFHN
jgi:hypothetical protein